MIEERLRARLADSDYYEENESHPTEETILKALNLLLQIPPDKAAEVEISPFWGEIFLDWEHKDRHVKAFCCPMYDPFCGYWDRMENGRVVESHLEPNTSVPYLTERLEWMLL